MSDYAEIKETLETKGARIILRHLKRMHARQYLAYRKARTQEEVLRIQAKQYALELIPQLLEEVMNAHIPKPEGKPQKKEWFYTSWEQFKDGSIRPIVRRNR